MRTKGWRVGLVALLLAVTAPAAADSLVRLLPGDDLPGGWVRRGEVRLFVGPELYRHINGGAELYHQNGFRRLAVQDYARGECEIRVEIYQMNDADGCSAVFAELSAGLEVKTSLGTACVLDDYQVLFLRRDCLVSLTTYEKSAEATAAMERMARHIDEALATALP